MPDDVSRSAAAAFGWEQVRQVPAAFTDLVAKAEETLAAFYQSEDPHRRQVAIAAWERIVNDPRFEESPLTFQLDALNRCGVAHWVGSRRPEAELSRAESCWRQALNLAPDPWEDRWRYVHNLGNLARSRYESEGSLSRLNEAIALLEEAQAIAPATDRNSLLAHHGLAIALNHRYQRQGTLDDLERAIAHGEIALQLGPPGSLVRGNTLSMVGGYYGQRFTRSGALEDIERSVDLLRAAVEGAEADGPNGARLPQLLTNLGYGMLERYRVTRDRDNLDEALSTQRRAVAITRAGDPLLAPRLNNLGNCLAEYAYYSGAVSDLAATIDAYARAVDFTASTDPWLTSRLFNLANAVATRHRVTGHRADLHEAIARYHQACTTGMEYSLEWGLGSAKAWGALAEERGEWQEADEAYGFGLEIVERLYRAQLLEKGQQSWLAEARDLARDAAYTQAVLNRFDDAVRTLEQGRTRALNDALEYQGPAVQGLSKEDRDALERARLAIEQAQSARLTAVVEAPSDVLVRSQALRQAHGELATVVERIRSYIPNFGGQGLRVPEIAALAAETDRPFVYLMTTRRGSLALLVPPSLADSGIPDNHVEPVWMPEFQEQKLESILYDEDDRLGYLHGAVSGDIPVLSQLLDTTLPLLAEQLMSPVAARLAELGFHKATLIPIGTLGLLPLHAAVLDSIEFSYAPSARALRMMLRDADDATLQKRLLGIDSPSSAGLPPLPFAHFEIADAAALFESEGYTHLVLNEQAATLRNIADNLRGSTHLHFACHGSFELGNPLKSSLAFAGHDALTLEDLLYGGLDVSAARLAVLSACQTSVVDFRNVPDEAVGFAAGFIRAGVPGVMSTLWPVNDVSTGVLLTRFYRNHLLKGDEPGRALQRAQLWMRDATAADMDLASRWQRLFIRSAGRDKNALLAARYFRANPDARTFMHPYFWAGFVFAGV